MLCTNNPVSEHAVNDMIMLSVWVVCVVLILCVCYRSAEGTRSCCWCCEVKLRAAAASWRFPPGRPPLPESEPCPHPLSAPPGSGLRMSTLPQKQQYNSMLKLEIYTPILQILLSFRHPASHPAAPHQGSLAVAAQLQRAEAAGPCCRSVWRQTHNLTAPAVQTHHLWRHNRDPRRTHRETFVTFMEWKQWVHAHRHEHEHKHLHLLVGASVYFSTPCAHILVQKQW